MSVDWKNRRAVGKLPDMQKGIINPRWIHNQNDENNQCIMPLKENHC